MSPKEAQKIVRFTAYSHRLGGKDIRIDYENGEFVAHSDYADLLADYRRQSELLEEARKLRDGYASQARFADVDAASYFREFVRRMDTILAKLEAGR